MDGHGSGYGKKIGGGSLPHVFFVRKRHAEKRRFLEDCCHFLATILNHSGRFYYPKSEARWCVGYGWIRERSWWYRGMVIAKKIGDSRAKCESRCHQSHFGAFCNNGPSSVSRCLAECKNRGKSDSRNDSKNCTSCRLLSKTSGAVAYFGAWWQSGCTI